MSCYVRVVWAVGLLLGFVSAVATAQTTWVVNTGGEPAGGINSASCGATCTLRDAINASVSGDTIQFDNSLGGTTIALTLYSNDLSNGSTEFGPSAFFITGGKTLTIDGVTGLSQGITIAGPGAAGAIKFRLFDVDAGSSLAISGLTLSNGYAKGGSAIGSTYSGGGALGAGGAIFNRGTLTIDRCTFTGNTAEGGSSQTGTGTGNSNGGGGVGQDSPDTTMAGGGPNGGSGSIFSSGGAGGFGGGGGGSALLGGNGGFGGGGGTGGVLSGGGNGGFGGGGGGPLVGSQGVGGFGGGDATGNIGGGGAGMGGAIFNDAGSAAITNSTFYANTAKGGFSAGSGIGAGKGGALFNYNGTLDLYFVTAGYNTVQGGVPHGGDPSDGGAIYSHMDSATGGLSMNNSIAAYSSPLYDVYTDGLPVFSQSSNLIESADYNGSIVPGVDPQVAYGANGGLAPTFLPAVGSPAIDAAASCTASIDQRGSPRPQGSACDIGSVEVVIPCHVKAGASGANTGENWTDAFPILDIALFDAFYKCLEVWVAEGTYVPGFDTSFDVRPGRAVYGGFYGTELQRPPGNLRTAKTVLAGDGSHRVVSIDGTTANGTVGADTVLDGFVITGGTEVDGGGLYCNGAGAGHRCNPTLSNLQFVGNTSTNAGGALYNDGSNGGDSSPTITNSTFAYNSTGTLGGALLDDGQNTGKSSPVLMNVTFVGNHAGSYGGAVADYAPNNGTSNPNLVNVTFSGNSASSGAGAMTSVGDVSACSTVLMPLLTNVIAWGDTSPGTEVQDGACGLTMFNNSLIQGSGGSAAWNTNFGIDGGGNLDVDPLFGALQYNGGPTQTKMIGFKSPAQDAGSDTACPNTDQRGAARPVGFHCDIGAVERQAVEDDIFNNGFGFF